MVSTPILRKPIANPQSILRWIETLQLSDVAGLGFNEAG
jgi:hypothetical protein